LTGILWRKRRLRLAEAAATRAADGAFGWRMMPASVRIAGSVWLRAKERISADALGI
jgi:hypothetical protein